MFEACNAAERIIPYIECPLFDISILGKMILSFLRPHLTNEQFHFLELKAEEAEYLVSLFSKAVEAPDLRAEGNSIAEVLTFLINFSRQCGQDVEDQIDMQPSKKEVSSFKANYDKRKCVLQNNVQIIAVYGILIPLETLLALPNNDPLVMAQALQLLWNLLHLDSIVKAFPSSLKEVVQHLQPSPDSGAQSLVLCVRWLLSDLDKKGNTYYTLLHDCTNT